MCRLLEVFVCVEHCDWLGHRVNVFQKNISVLIQILSFPVWSDLRDDLTQPYWRHFQLFFQWQGMWNLAWTNFTTSLLLLVMMRRRLCTFSLFQLMSLGRVVKNLSVPPLSGIMQLCLWSYLQTRQPRKNIVCPGKCGGGLLPASAAWGSGGNKLVVHRPVEGIWFGQFLLTLVKVTIAANCFFSP